MLYKVIILVIISCNFCSIAQERNKRKMHLMHFLPRTSIAHNEFLRPWANKIEQETHDQLEVRIHPAMSLGGSPSDLVEKVRSGAIDAAWTVVGYTPNLFPKTEIFELPFLTNTLEISQLNMLINEFYESHLKDEYEDFYVVLLHSASAGSLHMNGNEIVKLEDLKNLRIRSPSKIMSNFLKDIGSIPIQMPSSDAYESLVYNSIDGAMMSSVAATPLFLHEQTNYHVIAPFYTTIFAFLINKDFYDSLPKNIQSVIRQNSREHIAYNTGTIWYKAEKQMIEEIEKQGGKIHYLSNDEIIKGRKIAEKSAKEWINNNNRKTYNIVRDLLEKYQKQESPLLPQ